MSPGFRRTRKNSSQCSGLAKVLEDKSERSQGLYRVDCGKNEFHFKARKLLIHSGMCRQEGMGAVFRWGQNTLIQDEEEPSTDATWSRGFRYNAGWNLEGGRRKKCILSLLFSFLELSYSSCLLAPQTSNGHSGYPSPLCFSGR